MSIPQSETQRSTLRTWNPPAGMAANDTFSVRVRQGGGEWRDLFVYRMRVDHEHNGGPYDSSMVHFDFDGTVTMEVTFAGEITTHEFRPASFGIEAEREGKRLTFKLTQDRAFPRKFVLRVNDSWNEQVLHVFTNPPEQDPPAPEEVDYYFGGGEIHDVGELDLSRSDGKRVYVAGGAVFRGYIRANRAKNLTIGGRGILEDVVIRSNGAAENVRLDGLILMHTTHWAVTFQGREGGPPGPRNVEITNMAIVTHGVRGRRCTPDGIHFDAAVDCRASGCFIRACDDLLNADARYARRDTRNIVFENMVLWCDRAHSMMVGYKGTPGDRETVCGVTFRNIDVINQVTCSVMQIFVADDLTIRDITFEDIRIMPYQGAAAASLFEIDMRFNHWAHGNGLAVRNVTYRNIDYSGEGERASAFMSKGPLRTIEGLRFVNYRRAGKLVERIEDANVDPDPYVHDVQFFPTDVEPSEVRVDWAAPHELRAPVPYAAAMRSGGPMRINFDSPPAVRAGGSLVLSDIRLLDGMATGGTLHLRCDGVGDWHELPMEDAAEQSYQATIARRLTTGTFEYFLTMRREDGEIIREPAAGTIRVVPDRAPPSEVDELRATRADASGVTIRWAAAEDDGWVARYDVFRRGNGAENRIAELPPWECAFSTATVQAGERIVLGVRAVDAAKRAGQIAWLEIAVPKQTVAPPTPDVHLSDLEFAAAITGWEEILRDRNADEYPIRLGGTKYTKGVGVHAESEIVVDLRPDWRRFVAVVGVDDQKGNEGSVIAKVFADDEPLDHSPVLRGGKAPWPIDVAIPPGAARLRLVVTDAYDTLEGDLADWANAGFLTG